MNPIPDPEESELARRHQVFRAGLIAIAAIAVAVVAVFFAVWAFKEKEVAETKTELVLTKQVKANAQEREASRADFAAAQKLLAENKWQEAVAHLGRAIRYDPENLNAQDALWLALRHGTRDNARLLHTFTHNGNVTLADFTPDSSRIVTASDDKTAHVWDAKTYQPVGGPLIHGDDIVIFSPDSTRLITRNPHKIASIGSTMSRYTPKGRNVRFWDVKAGREIREKIQVEYCASQIAFSPDGARVAIFSNGPVRVYNTNTGQQIGIPIAIELPYTATFSPDGTRMVSVGKDKVARIWDVDSGQQIGEPLKSNSDVNSAEFSPNGAFILTVHSDQSVFFWDAKTCQQIRKPLKHAGCKKITFAPDGTHFVTLSADTMLFWDIKNPYSIGSRIERGKDQNSLGNFESVIFSPDGSCFLGISTSEARVWDTRSCQDFGPRLTHEGSRIHSALFSPDGTRILTTGENGTACIWDAKSLKQIGSTLRYSIIPLNHGGTIYGAKFSPDGTRILTIGAKDVCIWDVNSCQSSGVPLVHDKVVQFAIFSPDGSRIVTGCDDNAAHIWDTKTGEQTCSSLKHNSRLFAASYSADGSQIATQSNEVKTVQIWNAKSGEQIGDPLKYSNSEYLADKNRSFIFHRGLVSEDRTHLLAINSDGKYCVHNATLDFDKSVATPLKYKGEIFGAILTPDGTRVAISGGSGVCIMDAKTGEQIGALLIKKGGIFSDSFSPDGTSILIQGEKGIYIMDMKTGEQLGATLSPAGIGSFSPDGTRIVTTHEKGAVCIWDAKTGQQIGPLLRQGSQATGATFSPDGTRVVSTGGTRMACIWDVKSKQRIGADIAEALTAYCSGVRFDSELGTLQVVGQNELELLLKKLSSVFRESDDWRFIIGQSLPQDPQTALFSSRMTTTVREISTRLFASYKIGEASAIDSTHPLLPFVHRVVVWTYGNRFKMQDVGALSLLSANVSAGDLRLAVNGG